MHPRPLLVNKKRAELTFQRDMYGSMQLDELIPNITLVFLKNVSVLVKTIPWQNPQFLRDL